MRGVKLYRRRRRWKAAFSPPMMAITRHDDIRREAYGLGVGISATSGKYIYWLASRTARFEPAISRLAIHARYTRTSGLYPLRGGRTGNI